MDGFPHQGVFFFNVAAKNRHAAHANGKGKERLVHGAHHNAAIDLSKIRHQVKFQAFCRARQEQAVHRQHQHQHQQGQHHIFGNALQPALQVKA